MNLKKGGTSVPSVLLEEVRWSKILRIEPKFEAFLFLDWLRPRKNGQKKCPSFWGKMFKTIGCFGLSIYVWLQSYQNGLFWTKIGKIWLSWPLLVTKSGNSGLFSKTNTSTQWKSFSTLLVIVFGGLLYMALWRFHFTALMKIEIWEKNHLLFSLWNFHKLLVIYLYLYSSRKWWLSKPSVRNRGAYLLLVAFPQGGK